MTVATIQSSKTYSVPWWLVLLQGIAGVIIGLLLLTYPAKTTVFLVQFLGIYWFVSGIFGIISLFIDSSHWGWKLFAGLLGIFAGILILQHPLWSTVLVPTTLVIILGIQGLIIGVVNLIHAFRGGGWGIGILGVLSIGFGLVLLANIFVSALVLPYVAGALGVVGGIIAIFYSFKLK
jgi:uncharacterized membrane protein HdeD (DUF308 family)